MTTGDISLCRFSIYTIFPHPQNHIEQQCTYHCSTIMPQIPYHSRNALSNSPSGESYIGLGCFPLGRHITHTDVSELVSTLHNLRSHKMLHPISTTSFQELEGHLVSLRAAQGIWPYQVRDSPQSHAIQESLDDVDIKSERLQVYTFPDSTRLSSTAP